MAAGAGATVVPIDKVHLEHGDGHGKGNVLWASLLASRGDIVVFRRPPLRPDVPEELDDLFSRYAALKKRPTGIYLPSDHFCGLFYRSMRHRGIEPRRDFEVVVGNFTDVVYQNLDPLPAGHVGLGVLGAADTALRIDTFAASRVAD